MTLNYFIFNCKNCLQIKCRAMYENNMLSTICQHFYWPFLQEIQIPFIKATSLIYFRFIYNIFLKWAGNKIHLVKFVKYQSIKFLYGKISKEKTSFLDTETYSQPKQGLQLHIKIFRNKTDHQTFLKIDLKHPKSLWNTCVGVSF